MEAVSMMLAFEFVSIREQKWKDFAPKKKNTSQNSEEQ
jgi:hypothetical protein